MYLFPRRQRHKSATIVRSSFDIQTDHPLIKTYMDHLPYRLTGAQQRVRDNICSDLNLKKTVFRLIQGM